MNLSSVHLPMRPAAGCSVHRVAVFAMIGIVFLAGGQARASFATATVGQKVTISVTANGTTPFTYQWQKNGANISGATNATHVINNVQLSDAGNFTVLVSNSAGSILSDIAILSVNPPLIVPPAAPSGLGATDIASDHIDLAWTDNSGDETGFHLERSTDNSTFTLLATPAANVTTHTDATVAAGTTYYYRVRAFNGSGNSAYSNTAVVTPPPAPAPPSPPDGLGAAAVSSSQIDLTWTDNAIDELGFLVERSQDNSTFTQIATLAANTTAYSSTGLSSNTTYYYRVRAFNNAGNSAYSNTANATTQPPPPTPPAAPSGLGATSILPNRIDLAWTDNSANEQGFHFERSLNGVTFTLLATIPAGTAVYSDTGLNPNTTYHYRVRAFNNAGNSSYSTTASVTTLPPPPVPPTAPDGLAATAVSSSQINLTWTDNASDEQGLRVERSTDNSTFAEIAALGPDATAYSDTGLAASTTYYYRVRAFNTVGTSGYSNTASTDTLPPPVTPPVAPGGLAATAISAGQINLTWTDNSANEQGFRVERSTDNLVFTQITTLGPNITAYSNTGLTAGTTYFYRIRAFNSSGNSPYSNTASALTPVPPSSPPTAPSGLTATALSTSRIDLAWTDGASDEQGFEIERSINGTTFARVATVAPNTTAYSNTGLSSSTTYHYRVRAFNSAGNSAYSSVANATTAVAPVVAVAVPTGPLGSSDSPSGPGSQGGFSAPSADSLFPYPVGVALDSASNLYVTDASSHTVKKISPLGVVAIFAGIPGTTGLRDGAGSQATFNQPYGVAVDASDNVYVADMGNGVIRKITPSGSVSTLAGSVFQRGNADGPGVTASFASPGGIALDKSSGNLYVADALNATIRKITPAGVVSTLAGNPAIRGDADGTGGAALFNFPFGVAVDAAGAIYVADTYNNTIRKITPAGVVTTLAGSAGISGSFDGAGMFALFNVPAGVSTDTAGNVYVADTGNSTIRKIAPGGVVTTVAGIAGIAGLRDDVGSNALFNQPRALVSDNSGTLYIADTGNGLIRVIMVGNAVVTPTLEAAPAEPPPSSTGTGSGSTTVSSSVSGPGGGALEGWFVLMLALLVAVRARRRL